MANLLLTFRGNPDAGTLIRRMQRNCRQVDSRSEVPDQWIEARNSKESLYCASRRCVDALVKKLWIISVPVPVPGPEIHEPMKLAAVALAHAHGDSDVQNADEATKYSLQQTLR